ncbi:hypothetical protein CVT25_003740 [Psilocybe cyanescens]|uniref:Fungal-type protein kinase domain-containing protein n=1 Tax=Psilocybe cyanescens TaxID=93625 RepID=A0A409XW53_PSICY|nr:hypothetical protein CVT25_003740 [Psilocybe cyanescens]
MRPAVKVELRNCKESYETDTKNIYRTHDDLPIEQFLRECSLYDHDSVEWKELKQLIREAQRSQSRVAESSLYEPLCRIIQAIFDYFDEWQDLHPRWVKDTHNNPMDHKEETDVLYFIQNEEGEPLTSVTAKTAPDLSIMGGGPYLSGREIDVDTPQYAHCISPLEVKTEATLNKASRTSPESLYRQCFIQQPHRRYVPTVVLTESRAHVHVYDRSGVLRLTPSIDIHADAVAFVRTIIGISTVFGGSKKNNEFDAPFDYNVQWVADTDYPQIQIYNQWTSEKDDKESDSEDFDGSSEASDWDSEAPEKESEGSEEEEEEPDDSGEEPNGSYAGLEHEESDAEIEHSGGEPANPTVQLSDALYQDPEYDCSTTTFLTLNLYDVTNMRFVRRTVTGRGTVCWDAVDAETGQAVLIKDSWRYSRRIAEWKLLMQTKDMDGVGQMIAFEDRSQSSIVHFRHFICYGFPRSYSHNRIFSRIVLQAYGQSIRHFDSKLHLLYAFRDAVAGHRNLWMSGILHRDVSIDNVLLGQDGSKEGNRGVLIDFDMAIKVDRIRKPSQHLIRTGTRAFQSIAVLNARVFEGVPPPQDHLDDLESFLYILAWICLKHNGPHSRSMSPEFLDDWESPKGHVCSAVKTQFLIQPTTMLQQYFNNEIFKTLLKALAGMCYKHYLEKVTISSEQEAPPTLIDVHKKAQATHHDAFLRCIDEAIEKQQKEKEDWVRPPVTPPAKSVQRGYSKKSGLHKVTRGGNSKNKRRGDHSDDDDGPGPSKRSKASAE